MRALDVFGVRVLVEQTPRGWAAYYPGADGKHRPAHDLPIPAFVETEAQLVEYLADLCHERAAPGRAEVRWAE